MPITRNHLLSPQKILEVVFAMIAFLVLWTGASALLPPTLFASPLQVAQVFVTDFPLLSRHLGMTMGVSTVGALVGLAAGLAAGYLLYRSPVLARFLTPALTLSQTIPLVFLFPLLVLWLGFGPSPRVVVVGLGTFFPVALAYFRGLAAADPEVIDLFNAMQMPRRRLFYHVIFPGSLPYLLGGIQLASVYILPTAVIGEWLGARDGLGVYMLRSYKSFRIDRVTAAIFLVSLLSWLTWKASCEAEKRIVFWKIKEVNT